MQDTEHAPAEGGLQERQLVAGRYRLTARHHEDETTDVWRGFDEPVNHVVILTFLRDRSPASRDRFVTEARRMALQPPTVMRIAGIHDDADLTFIVYEDVVPGSSTELTDESSIGHGLSGLRTVIGLRDPALIDSRLLMESATEFAASARSRLAEVRLDEARLKTIAAQARPLLDRVVVEGWIGRQRTVELRTRVGVRARHARRAAPDGPPAPRSDADAPETFTPAAVPAGSTRAPLAAGGDAA